MNVYVGLLTGQDITDHVVINFKRIRKYCSNYEQLHPNSPKPIKKQYRQRVKILTIFIDYCEGMISYREFTKKMVQDFWEEANYIESSACDNYAPYFMDERLWVIS